jgi:hypothetical protein
MLTLRQPVEKIKITIEQLALSTRCPLRKGGTAYLKWLLTRDDLDNDLRQAVQAELERRQPKRKGRVR